ncbi:MAG: TolC family protein [Candidatus Kapabacteria bacterium]|nr:TolC family protein [Candidatus Kapabacteria bacterium]
MIKYFLILLIYFPLNAQLRLQDCYNEAITKCPLARNIALNYKSSNLTISNLDKVYYPEISLSGQLQWQNEVTKINLPLNIPGFKMPEISKDQYKLVLNVNQLVWDGGMSSALKSLESTGSELENQNLKVELYKLKQRINEAFFGIVLIKSKLRILDISKIELEQKLKILNFRIESGLILGSNADILKAEILKLDQNIEELSSGIETAYQAIELLIERKLNRNDSLIFPEIDIKAAINERLRSLRPEYELFKLSHNNLELNNDRINAKNLPKFSAYAQAGYGKPGLNFLDPDFKPLFLIGLRGNWNIYDWGIANHEHEIIKIKQELLLNQEESFTKNLEISLTKYKSDLSKLESLIQKDKEIVNLRKNIASTAYFQLENGIITATDYLSEFNSNSTAEIIAESRKVELSFAKISILTVLNYDFK